MPTRPAVFGKFEQVSLNDSPTETSVTITAQETLLLHV